jgi:hypothetical protein
MAALFRARRALAPRDMQTAQALAAFCRPEIEKWRPIIKAANVRADSPRARPAMSSTRHGA